VELLANLAFGLASASTPSMLLYCFFGVLLGTFVGVLPGVGALAAISLLLPWTYHIPAAEAIVMLAGVYYGAAYGGSTAAILLNIPGSASSVVVCLDGYPMARQGRAGIALFITAIASFVGAMTGLLILLLFSNQIAEIGLRFGAPEYFSLLTLGLVAAATMSGGSVVKGIAMVLLGLLLSMVGTDINSGVIRYTFGWFELMDGLSLIALAIGVFGVAEVVSSINQVTHNPRAERITLASMLPSASDWKRALPSMLRGSGIGSFIGALPGAGGSIASFMAYAAERRVARDRSRFGQGAIEGVAAPEASNNAAVQTAFIPSLTLGIPGDAVMALMLGALILHGITPGPLLISEQPVLFWGLVGSFVIGNLLLLVLNIPMIGLWVRMLSIPYRMLYPAIIIFMCLGVYSVNNSTFDILLVVGFGLLGYLCMVLKFPMAPLLLGFILGPMMEENFRRALRLSRGDPAIFIERPISLAFLVVTGLILVWMLVMGLRQRASAAE
jgi:putative tricarboxylic transport membrane protein